MKKLIITEKPSVAADFIKVLDLNYSKKKGYFEGENYIITWCVGHLITMCYPEKYGEEYKVWSFETLPFIPDKYLYEVISSVKEQYNTVKECLNRSDIDTIYYAGDAAREGEYIQRLVRQKAGRNKNAIEKRIWIDSQTEEEIKRGVREAKALSEYDAMADSGYARAIEDYLVGMNFSRALSIKYGSGFNNLAKTSKYTPISVGRVMSCVLGMIVDRERDIRNAVEIPFYGVSATTDNNVSLKWKAVEGSSYYKSSALFQDKDDAFTLRQDAENLVNSLTGKSLKVNYVNSTTEKKMAPLLFNLAELQAECSKKFKISPDETLVIVQALYDKKMTTYPRTDARVLSSAVGDVIENNIDGLKNIKEYKLLAEKAKEHGIFKFINKTKYVNDEMVSDHYAIIPTGEHTHEYEGLAEIEQAVYDLIVRRFLSIFYPAAEYDKVSAECQVDNEKFYTSTKVLTSLGYLELYKEDEEDDLSVYNAIMELKDKGSVSAEYNVSEGKTSIPKRYSSGSMILAMENAGNLIEDAELREQIKSSGIGTSATRAEIIKKLLKNGFISLNTKTQIITPSMSGEILYEIVKATTPSLLNPVMTANWEKGLSLVSNGNITKEEYLSKMDAYIRKEIQKIKEENVVDIIKNNVDELRKVYKDIGSMENSGKSGNSNSGIGECPLCKNPVRIMDWGAGCSGYKDGCKFSISRKAFGAKLTDKQLEKLFTSGMVKNVKCYSQAKQKEYEANIKMDKDGKLSLAFDNND